MARDGARGADPTAWGIELEYLDYKKDVRRPPAESVRFALEAMDASEDGPPSPRARFVHPGERPDLTGVVSITTEDGGSIGVDPGGGTPAELPLGYHEAVDRDGRTAPLIVAPRACWLPPDLRAWGWAVQLYAARSRRSWGIGDLGDLHALGEWAARMGADAVLLNPLHAAAPGKPQEPSPYFPSSRRWRNPLYIAVEDVSGAADVDVTEAARAGSALNASDRIDRDAVLEVKLGALERIWAEWSGAPAFEQFVADNGDALRDFATYSALCGELGGGPATWPAGFSRPDAPEVAGWRDAHEDRVRFHSWLQWLLDEQLARAGEPIGLVHDLAIGVDPHGADAWLWHASFAPGMTVGAPPDEFNARGQDWGLPPFDPWKLRAASYEPFIATVRASLRHAAGLRIDHVMGLFRLYWVPAGASPSDGVYVRYPHDDLLDIVALESVRARAYVVGEDLGTVEDLVREEMARRDMLSYKLMWFEDDAPARWPYRSLGAVTNHDLPTIAGVWTGADMDDQRSAGLDPDPDTNAALEKRLLSVPGVERDDDVGGVIEAAHRALAKAPSAVVVATLEDALGVELRPNLPGTLRERPNWSMKLPVSIEDLSENTGVAVIGRALSRRRGSSQAWRHAFADVGDVRLHYVEAGDGPLVVLLHGFPDFWYSWRRQIAPLADAGFRVVAPDMRGYNESDKPRGVAAYGVDRLVDDVAGLVAALGGGRAHVVGHDWGGVVAWFAAMTRPEVVDRLAIVNAPHPRRYLHALSPKQMLKSWYFLFFQLPWLPERALSMQGYRALRRALPSEASARDLDDYVLAAERADALHYPINYYRALLRARPVAALRSFQPVDAPALVLWGADDPFLEVATADPGPEWADVMLRVFPGAGHWLHLEEPDAVNDALIAFLS